MTVRPVLVPVCERIYLHDEEATAHGEWPKLIPHADVSRALAHFEEHIYIRFIK